MSENEGTAAADLGAAVAQMPFAAALGVVLDAVAADEVRGHLAWAPDRCTTAGVGHGHHQLVDCVHPRGARG